MPEGHTAIAYRQETPPIGAAFTAVNDNPINILLVEDDYKDSLLTIQTVNSTRVPYNLDRITQGDDVVPYLQNCMQERMPDLLLLDMGLPGTNGFEILETLAKAPACIRAIPIAIITGHAHFDYLQHNSSLPIYGYVTKPLRAEKLRPILDKVTAFKRP